MIETFPIAPGQVKFAWPLMSVALVALGVVSAVVYSALVGVKEAAGSPDGMAPGIWTNRTPLFGLIIVVIAIAAFTYSLASARRSHFDVGPNGLAVHGDFYGRFIPRSHLIVGQAQAITLSAGSSYTPVRRTIGTAFDGYSAGWFYLRNGNRALVYLTDRTRVVYVPTTENYVVLLSVPDPQAFLTALRSATE